MRRCLLIILPAVLFLSGCKVDMEVWVKNDGSGKGTMIITDTPFILEGDLKSKLQQKGMELTSFAQTNATSYKADFRWSNFAQSFGERTEAADGIVFLDFGKVSDGTLTIHVTGDIDQNRTNGRIVSKDTVIFESGRARVWYKPSPINSANNVVALLIGFGVIFIGLLIYFTTREPKKPMRPMAPLVARTPPAPKPVAEPPKPQAPRPLFDPPKPSGEPPLEINFCYACGNKLEPDHLFCSSCGKKNRS